MRQMLEQKNGYKKESKTVDYEKAYKDLLVNNIYGLRERIVLEVLKHRPKYTAEMTTAAALTLINFIENKIIHENVGRAGPSLPMDFEVFLPKQKGGQTYVGPSRRKYTKIGKRKYTKKSKFWAKKKSA